MTQPTKESLWNTLRERGIVEGDLPAAGETASPWFVRVMLGIAGWIGALFLLGFVGVGFSFVLKNESAAFVIGLLACVAASVIFRVLPKNDFVAQFGLAVSLAGQILTVFGASDWFDHSKAGIALYIAIQQAALFAAMPNFVHRVWAAWTAALAVAFAMLDLGLYVVIPGVTTAAFVLLALSEFRFARQGALIRPAIYGLALAAVQTAVLHGNLLAEFVGRYQHAALFSPTAGLWLGRVVSLAVLLMTVFGLLKRDRLSLSSNQSRIALIGALALGLFSMKAPGVGPATAILLIGFANANRILTGLGIFALIGYLSHYYYSLGTTLLEKSILLMAFGSVLLVARLVLKKFWPETSAGYAEAPHA